MHTPSSSIASPLHLLLPPPSPQSSSELSKRKHSDTVETTKSPPPPVSPSSSASTSLSPPLKKQRTTRRRTIKKIGTTCRFWYSSYCEDGYNLIEIAKTTGLVTLFNSFFCKPCRTKKTGQCLFKSRTPRDWLLERKNFIDQCQKQSSISNKKDPHKVTPPGISSVVVLETNSPSSTPPLLPYFSEAEASLVAAQQQRSQLTDHEKLKTLHLATFILQDIVHNHPLPHPHQEPDFKHYHSVYNEFSRLCHQFYQQHCHLKFHQQQQPPEEESSLSTLAATCLQNNDDDNADFAIMNSNLRPLQTSSSSTSSNSTPTVSAINAAAAVAAAKLYAEMFDDDSDGDSYSDYSIGDDDSYNASYDCYSPELISISAS